MQFLKFLITGGIAALANFGSRFFFDIYFNFETSILFAYLIGMVTAFMLAKSFVFKNSQNSTREEISYFVLVNLFALVQTFIISLALSEYLFPKISFTYHPKALAHGIGIIFPVFSSYIGHKKLSFNNKLKISS